MPISPRTASQASCSSLSFSNRNSSRSASAPTAEATRFTELACPSSAVTRTGLLTSMTPRWWMIRERRGIVGTCRYYDVPMTLLAHGRYCDEVITQTDLLRDILRGAELSVTVPTCPDWTLAELVRHIGGNLRSVDTAVRTV